MRSGCAPVLRHAADWRCAGVRSGQELRGRAAATPGAAIFVPEGTGDPTRAGRYEALSLDQVAERTRRADGYSPAAQDGLQGESSTLPGMIPKITQHRDADGWYACKDGAASTWIMKRAAPAGTRIADVVDTEVACLDLARRVGLTTVSAEIFDHDGVRAIAVSRFDRTASTRDPRLHQEDLAQATGVNTQDPNRKFQWGKSTPSLKHAADVVRLDGGNPDSLLELATFTYLVGNTDMHAKNVSFMRWNDGRATLSPAYDIAMHLHHDGDNRRSALDVNGKFLISDITLDDLIAEGQTWGLPQRRARRVALSLAEKLAEALSQIDRSAHPAVPPKAWAIVENRTHHAAAGKPLGTPAQSNTRTKPGPRRPR